jgi:hypothetical protein
VGRRFGTTVPSAGDRRAFVRRVACAPDGAYLVWFDDGPRELLAPRALADLVEVRRIARVADGALYRLTAPVDASC